MSQVVAAYVPQLAVIWPSREPERQCTDYGPRSFAVWGQQAGTRCLKSFRDATPTLGQFQRRLKPSLFRLATGVI